MVHHIYSIVRNKISNIVKLYSLQMKRTIDHRDFKIKFTLLEK